MTARSRCRTAQWKCAPIELGHADPGAPRTTVDRSTKRRTKATKIDALEGAACAPEDRVDQEASAAPQWAHPPRVPGRPERGTPLATPDTLSTQQSVAETEAGQQGKGVPHRRRPRLPRTRPRVTRQTHDHGTGSIAAGPGFRVGEMPSRGGTKPTATGAGAERLTKPKRARKRSSIDRSKAAPGHRRAQRRTSRKSDGLGDPGDGHRMLRTGGTSAHPSRGFPEPGRAAAERARQSTMRALNQTFRARRAEGSRMHHPAAQTPRHQSTPTRGANRADRAHHRPRTTGTGTPEIVRNRTRAIAHINRDAMGPRRLRPAESETTRDKAANRPLSK